MNASMNEAEAALILKEECDYRVRGHLPSGWVLIAPDGRFIREGEFVKELERLTAPGSR